MELAVADAARLVTTEADASNAGSAVNAFGLDLYRSIVADGPGRNHVMSPASIALALGMARAGARGQTAAEMDRLLRDLGTDGHAAWLAALDAALGARTETIEPQPFDGGDPQHVTLRIVNGPFAQRGFGIEASYLEALAGRFAAGLRLVDYRAAPDDARGLINAWVADQTERRIPALIPSGLVTVATRLVLVNAIYLKAAWAHPFPEQATAPRPFRRLDGSSVEVPMMAVTEHFRYAAGRGWRAVQLPYVGRKLAMLVVVPGDLAAFEAALDEPTLKTIANALRPTEVVLRLPRFGAETRLDLAITLAALGMPTAFSNDADFSGITRAEPLEISAVVHQANIDVDERGTEAAAATAVLMAPTAMPPGEQQPVELTVDRPFMFALRDLETGAILFLGRVTDPAAGSG